MKKIIYSVPVALLLVAALFFNVHAESGDLSSFNSRYGTSGTQLNTCNLCHPGGNTGSLNSYGNDYNRGSFSSIESLDSDGDGFTNLVEINARTFPGSSTSRPTATTPANRAPVANAGAAQTVDSEAAVTLNGSGSSDPDGNTLTYAWTQIGGTPAVTLTNANRASAGFTTPTVTAQTVFTFQLRVTDTGNLSSTATTTVTVKPASIPAPAPAPTPVPAQGPVPVADAGPDQTVSPNAIVILNGSRSRDDVGITSYTWMQIGPPAVTLSGANTAFASFEAPAVTTMTTLNFLLIVSDASGMISTDTCVITVRTGNDPIPTNPSPVPNGIAPIADAGLDMMVFPGTMNSLDGFYSTDSDDGIVSYAWTQIGGPSVTLSDPSAVNPIFLAPYDPATLTFRLVVTDRSGLQDDDTCTVVVLGSDGAGLPPVDPPASSNQPPVARAGSDQTVRSGSTVRLSGTSSTDPDDGIASYAWRQVSGISVRLSGSSSSSASFTAPQVGSSGTRLTFELTVKDRVGQSSSDTVVISVYEDHDDD